MRPANTITTTFVVWPEEVLKKHGYVKPITYGELINASERIRLSPSQIAAFEAGRQGNIPGIGEIVDIIIQTRVQKEPEQGETPIGTRFPPADSQFWELVNQTPNEPPPEPTPTREVPTRRPRPPME